MKLKELIFAAAVLPAGSQVMYKVDPARSGYSQAKLSAPVELAWRVEAGGEFYSSAAIDNGTAYLGNSDRHFHAYSLKDGALKWKSALPERVYGASPQLEGGRLYLTTVNACVHAVEPEDGRILHSTCLPEAGFFESGNDVLASPLVLPPLAYFGSDNGIFYAWKFGQAQPEWSFATGDKIHDCSPAYDGEKLITASGDGRLYAFDAATGKMLWKSEEFDALINSTPALSGGSAYVGCKDGKMRAYGLNDGKVRWEFATGKSVMSSPALDKRRISLVFGSADGFVYCLSQTEGTLEWKFKTGGMVLGTPLITGDTVWIGSYDDYFYGLDMDDGKEIFKHEAPGGVFASPAASGRHIVVGTRKGTLLAFLASVSK